MRRQTRKHHTQLHCSYRSSRYQGAQCGQANSPRRCNHASQFGSAKCRGRLEVSVHFLSTASSQSTFAEDNLAQAIYFGRPEKDQAVELAWRSWAAFRLTKVPTMRAGSLGVAMPEIFDLSKDRNGRDFCILIMFMASPYFRYARA